MEHKSISHIASYHKNQASNMLTQNLQPEACVLSAWTTNPCLEGQGDLVSRLIMGIFWCYYMASRGYKYAY